MQINLSAYNKLEFVKIKQILKNSCISSLGEERVENISFFNTVGELKNEFEKLKSFKNLILSGNDLQFNELRDIRDILEQIKVPGNYVSPEKFLYIRNFLNICKNVKLKLTSLLSDPNLLFKLAGEIYTDKLLTHHIEIVIDDNGTVKDNASKNLFRIRNQILDKKDILRKLLDKILKRFSDQEYTQEDIITLRDGRSVIPVKVENKRKVAGIIHSSSSTGYTVFIEPSETIELNNELTELHFEEIREVEKILSMLSQEINKFSEQLRSNCNIIAEIEFIRAKALYAIKYDCSEPDFESNQISINNGYHPLLLQKLGRSNVIPLNCSLSNDINTIIITGPNAGGKTVALKTIGLLQLMLQSGMQIPVSADSFFRLFNEIFVVIGDEQSIENDLSSFSSHLVELREIINSSEKNCLVLIDEICSGTDPRFGSSLAVAILEHLSNRNYFSVVTTHNGDLKIYAEKNKYFINASLDYDFEKLSPSFVFRIGIPGQSFTFELAEKIKIEKRIIEKAISYIHNDELKVEEILKSLNHNRLKYEMLKNEYDRKLNDLNILREEYSSKIGLLSKKKNEIIKEAKIEYEKIINEGRRIIEKTVKEIREKEKNISDIKKEFASATDIHQIKEIPNEVVNIFKSGDIVKLSGSETTGTITEIDGKIAFINSNNVVIKADLNSIELVSKEKFTTQKENSKIKLIEPFNNVIDIRGKYANEINDIIENFIYEGYLNNFEKLTIVHGKGTGKLKTQVHSILKNNKFIRKFRLGDWNEGESGVTIIELNI